jgi:hypothetical protein
MRFLRPLKRLLGMFHGFPGVLVPGLMIFFPVVRGGSTVRVRCEFVEFGCSLMRVIGHGYPRPQGHLHLSPSGFYKLFSNEHSGGAPVSL